MERRNLAWLQNRDTRNVVALTLCCRVQVALCKVPWRTGASCSRLGSGSTGRPVAKGWSVSNASSSQVWQADKSMDQGTGKLVAGPNERTTSKKLAFHSLSVSSENWAFVERVPQERARQTWSARARHNGTDFLSTKRFGEHLQMLVCGPLRTSTRIRKRINVFFETQISPIFSQYSPLRRTGSAVWTIRKYSV